LAGKSQVRGAPTIKDCSAFGSAWAGWFDDEQHRFTGSKLARGPPEAHGFRVVHRFMAPRISFPEHERFTAAGNAIARRAASPVCRGTPVRGRTARSPARLYQRVSAVDGNSLRDRLFEMVCRKAMETARCFVLSGLQTAGTSLDGSVGHRHGPAVNGGSGLTSRAEKGMGLLCVVIRLHAGQRRGSSGAGSSSSTPPSPARLRLFQAAGQADRPGWRRPRSRVRRYGARARPGLVLRWLLSNRRAHTIGFHAAAPLLIGDQYDGSSSATGLPACRSAGPLPTIDGLPGRYRQVGPPIRTTGVARLHGSGEHGWSREARSVLRQSWIGTRRRPDGLVQGHGPNAQGGRSISTAMCPPRATGGRGATAPAWSVPRAEARDAQAASSGVTNEHRHRSILFELAGFDAGIRRRPTPGSGDTSTRGRSGAPIRARSASFWGGSTPKGNPCRRFKRPGPSGHWTGKRRHRCSRNIQAPKRGPTPRGRGRALVRIDRRGTPKRYSHPWQEKNRGGSRG